MASQFKTSFKLKRAIQKEAFTAWGNNILETNRSSFGIKDLFKSLRNGHLLSDLLECLSGERLRRLSSGNSRRQAIDNVEICLTFLEQKRVSTRNIDSEDIVDGCPDTTLELMWAIITGLYINKKKLLKRGQSKTVEEALLLWAQDKTQGYRGVRVKDFTSSSWKNGLAFLALISVHRPDLIRFKDFYNDERRHNLKTAFAEAEDELGIPSLLDVEDMMNSDVDERAVAAYVACFYKRFSSSKYDMVNEYPGGSGAESYTHGVSSAQKKTGKPAISNSSNNDSDQDQDMELVLKKLLGKMISPETAPLTVPFNRSSVGFEWQSQNDYGAWRTFGKPNSACNWSNVSTTTSEDIENHFVANPNSPPVLVQTQHNCYILDFQSMTQTDQNTSSQRPIRRVRKQSNAITPGSASANVSVGVLPQTVPQTVTQTPVNASANVSAGLRPQTVPQTVHSDLTPDKFEWQFQDEHGSWISYGQPNSDGKVSHAITICSDDIERHYASNQANPAPLTIHNTIKCPYILDFKNLTQTNKQTSVQRKIRRVLRSSIANGVTSKVGSFEWSFKDEHGNWIKYGETSGANGTISATTTTSDDIETKFSQNPHQSFEISSGIHKYIIDFKRMTQTNIITKVVRAIRRQ